MTSRMFNLQSMSIVEWFAISCMAMVCVYLAYLGLKK